MSLPSSSSPREPRRSWSAASGRRRWGPGDYFGEIGLFHDQPRTATVTAESDLRCFALGAWDFRPFVEENPQVAWPIMQVMAQRLADNASP